MTVMTHPVAYIRQSLEKWERYEQRFSRSKGGIAKKAREYLEIRVVVVFNLKCIKLVAGMKNVLERRVGRRESKLK